MGLGDEGLGGKIGGDPGAGGGTEAGAEGGVLEEAGEGGGGGGGLVGGDAEGGFVVAGVEGMLVVGADGKDGAGAGHRFEHDRTAGKGGEEVEAAEGDGMSAQRPVKTTWGARLRRAMVARTCCM